MVLMAFPAAPTVLVFGLCVLFIYVLFVWCFLCLCSWSENEWQRMWLVCGDLVSKIRKDLWFFYPFGLFGFYCVELIPRSRFHTCLLLVSGWVGAPMLFVSLMLQVCWDLQVSRCLVYLHSDTVCLSVSVLMTVFGLLCSKEFLACCFVQGVVGTWIIFRVGGWSIRQSNPSWS
jgi:hypothetical protein